LGIALAALAGCTKENSAPTTTAAAPTPTPVVQTAAATPQPALTRITDRSLICMVNNQFMGRPQIPVQVDGKTYYGCCEMCKARLANDPTARTGVDPISNKPVDKSMAIIAKADTGAALYFENEQNYAAYAKRMGVQ
jgi:YHS domain-containing protein